MKKQLKLAVNILIGAFIFIFLIVFLKYRDVVVLLSGIFLNASRFLNGMDRGREYWDMWLGQEGRVPDFVYGLKYILYIGYVFILMLILGDKSMTNSTRKNIIIINILAIILAFVVKWFLFNNVYEFYLYMDFIPMIFLSLALIYTNLKLI